MFEIHKSSQTEVDLIDIWLYGNERWGAKQADLYLDQLDAGLNHLSQFPALGTECSELRNGYRVFEIGQHMVFYKIDMQIINVIRVLHQSMDFERHL